MFRCCVPFLLEVPTHLCSQLLNRPPFQQAEQYSPCLLNVQSPALYKSWNKVFFILAIRFRLGLLSLLVDLTCPTHHKRCPNSLWFCPWDGGGRLEFCRTRTGNGSNFMNIIASLILMFSLHYWELTEGLLCVVHREEGWHSDSKGSPEVGGQWDDSDPRSRGLWSLVPAPLLACMGLRASVQFHIPKAEWCLRKAPWEWEGLAFLRLEIWIENPLQHKGNDLSSVRGQHIQNFEVVSSVP